MKRTDDKKVNRPIPKADYENLLFLLIKIRGTFGADAFAEERQEIDTAIDIVRAEKVALYGG